MLQRYGFNVCGVYLVDAIFVTDASKLIAGNLMALSAMVHLELPHINVRAAAVGLAGMQGRVGLAATCLPRLVILSLRPTEQRCMLGWQCVTSGARCVYSPVTALTTPLPLQVLSKCDLIDKSVIERYLAPAGSDLTSELNKAMSDRFRNLNAALARIVSGAHCGASRCEYCGVIAQGIVLFMFRCPTAEAAALRM